MGNPYFKELPYKEASKKLAYNGKRVKVEEIEYSDGEKIIYREHVKAGNAVVILGITENNEVFMVQEPRPAVGKVILALPAGIINDGEEPIEAARREFEEETGYFADHLKFLREYYPSIGYSEEKIYIYLAKNMKKTKQHLDADEDINVISIPFDELVHMIDKNEIIDASTNIAVLHYLRYIQ